jgi:RNA polymerase sigma-70 factor (ECF subfamily)
VLAVCHARVGRSAAEDLAQEALLRGLRGLKTLAEAEKFGPWLIGIAVRTCLDWLKSSQRTEVSLESLQSRAGQVDVGLGSLDRPDHAGDHDRRERALHLMAEVERLPQPYRETLMLYYHQDCTYHELAEALGVSVAAINARLTKARAMLRSRLMAEEQL